MQVLIIEPSNRMTELLKRQPQVRITACTNFADARMQRNQTFDLVLVSAALPVPDVLDLIREQCERGQRTVVMDVAETDGQVIPFLEAGAVGYVPQTANASEMVSALAAIAEGKPPFAPKVGTALVERMHELLALQHQHAGEALRENCPDPTSLTVREREILHLIRGGASNQTIANELMIEVGTVKNHVHNILKKLNVTRRSQAASYADLVETQG